jgi:hypothetical protein
MSCAQFADAVRRGGYSELLYYTWAQGFLSARSEAPEHHEPLINLAVMSTDEQRRLLRSYCNEHPLAQYIDAVLNLEIVLIRQTTSDKWKAK